MSNLQIENAQSMLNAVQDAHATLQKASANRSYLKFYQHALQTLNNVKSETPETKSNKIESLRQIKKGIRKNPFSRSRKEKLQSNYECFFEIKQN